MCGIVGYFSKNSDSRKNIIKLMNDKLTHRGPDDEGTWFDNETGINLGHRRLSIQDLSKKASQPMVSFSKRFIIIFNGEIYNHNELRSIYKNELNVTWKSNSDTETLLEIIEKKGLKKSLEIIDGMFAFVIWDRKYKKLSLVRDRIGEKPIYYGWQGQGSNLSFLFGSELKPLKVHPSFDGDINRKAIQNLMTHNCIHAPNSIYQNIFKLEAGHFLELTINDLQNKILPKSKPYWSLSNIIISGSKNQMKGSFDEASSELEVLLKKTVKKQMIGDVPFGSFLSGGIDSSLITSLMQSESSSQINTFSIGFKENDYNEAKFAKKIANHLGTNHTEFYVDHKDALSVIPKLSTIYDEPFADSSQIPTYLLSKLTSKNVKVALTGDGGDEFFGGYNRYLLVLKWWKIINNVPRPINKLIRNIILNISTNHWNIIGNAIPFVDKYNAFGDKMHKGANVLLSKSILDLYIRLISHWDCSQLLENFDDSNDLTNISSKFNIVGDLDNQQRMMLVDGLTYLTDDILVKVDRAAMSNSLETRVPFLDHRLIEFSAKIPQKFKIKKDTGKLILRNILSKYVPKNFFERPKMGFGAPIDIWLCGPLRDWAESLINSNSLKNDGIFKSEIIQKKWKEHLSGKRNWQYHLWDVLIFQSWLKENK